MRTLDIFSWNAQGNFREKVPHLECFVEEHRAEILLIQEQGTIEPSKKGEEPTGIVPGHSFDVGPLKYICKFAVEDPAAKIHRCTTAIMVSENFDGHITDFNWEYCGVTRPLCYIDIAEGIRIATTHAIANQSESVLEVKAKISCLDEAKPGKWLFMGDFNSNPWDYAEDEYYANILNKVNHPYCDCFVLADENPTQGSKKREHYLDFAFIGNYMKDYCVGLLNTRVKDMGNRKIISDHNLIHLRVNI